MGRSGPKSNAPGGYGTITNKGYRRIWNTAQQRYKMEHVVIWESKNGIVPDGYHIHHRNEDKLDNRLENLELIDPLTHKRIHSGCKIIDGDWWKPCRRCGEYKPVSTEFYKRRDGISSECRSCCIERSVDNRRRRKLIILSNRATNWKYD